MVLNTLRPLRRSSQKNKRSPSEIRGFFVIFFLMTATQYLQFIVSAIVINTSAIEITEKQDELGTLLSLRVDPSDMGSLI
jgi:hypothetical protein